MLNKINTKLSKNSLILIYNDTNKNHSLIKKEEISYSLISMLGDYLPEPPVIRNTNSNLHKVLEIVLGNKSISKIDIGYSLSKNPVQLFKVEQEISDKDLKEAEEKAEKVKEILYGNNKEMTEKIDKEVRKGLQERISKTIKSSQQNIITPEKTTRINNTSLYGNSSSPIIIQGIKSNNKIHKNKINESLRLISKINIYSNFVKKMEQIQNLGKTQDLEKTQQTSKLIDLNNTIKVVNSIKKDKGDLSYLNFIKSTLTFNELKDIATAFMNDVHKLCIDSKYSNIDKLKEEIKKQDELDFITQILITDSEGKYNKDEYDLVLNLDNTFSTSKDICNNILDKDEKRDFNHFMLSSMKIKTLTNSLDMSEMFNNIDMSSNDLSSFSKINNTIEKYFMKNEKFSGDEDLVTHDFNTGITSFTPEKTKKEKSTTAKSYIEEIISTIPKDILEFSENLLK